MESEQNKQNQNKDDTRNKSSIGGIMGTIIIIVVIILGGLYFWGKRIEDNRLKENLTSPTAAALEAGQYETSTTSSFTEPGNLNQPANATSTQ